MEITSPITSKKNTVLEKTICSQEIIEKYKKMKTPIDVARFFNRKEVQIYRCLDTGYRFYYPFKTTGDDSFYQEMEKFPWYYMDWKWEYDVAENFIKKSDKVLEIGCAKGAFLKKIKENGAIVEGLEMNSSALKACIKKDLLVNTDSIEKFSTNKKNVYDIVCSFQVLEHVADVKNFIESSLYILKPGGLMIISVPNNDCLIFKEDVALNMPPHHMGLWEINSLIKLQNNFDMKLDSIHLEPLQKYHIGFADKIVKRKVEEKLQQKLLSFSFLFKKIANFFAFLGVSAVSKHIIGHSILVIFKKNDEKK